MEVTEALCSGKKEIQALWLERTLTTYTSSDFFKKAKNPFANPVGVNISQALNSLYDLLVSNAETEAMLPPLDQLIRIRAVQEFSPAQAVAPLLELKWVIKQVFSRQEETKALLSQLDQVDCDIDRMALAGFNIYVACREQLYQCRINELKSGNHVLTDSGCPSRLLDKETP
ncbi:MAG: hypothetical protein CSA32_01695 [Desulfobulbus propionicus]|nr:MAG: hypothetical protein CSA32_01695 [Desulfobulbus propionicus]